MHAKPPLVFMGSPEVAVTVLKTLVEAGYPIRAVITQPDKPAGRGQKLTAPPVKTYAVSENIEVFQPASLKDPSAIQKILSYPAQAIVVAAYGKIIPKVILESPPWGCLNVHFSLLPRYRGASCVASAIRNNDSHTGVSIMKVVEALDAGPIYRQERLEIQPSDTTGSLEEKLALLGGRILLKILEELKLGSATLTEQKEKEVSYAPLLKKEEAAIDWKQPAEGVDRLIRAMNPWPVAYTFLEGQRVKIYKAQAFEENSSASSRAGEILKTEEDGIKIACGRGTLLITELQPENKKRMSAADFLKGHSSWFQTGKVFS